MKMKNATSYTLLLNIETVCGKSDKHTHTYAQAHAYTAVSDESNRSLAYIEKKLILVFYIKLILVLC